MAYIYQITNDINGKIYIGKTEFDIQKRFKEHCKDAFSPTKEKRPLYAAMRKYGIEHFHIELLEETDNPEEREIYWIEQKRSFKNGYNATQGGDGKRYLDYDLIIATYKELGNLTETADKLNCDRHHVSTILKENNISTLSGQEVSRIKNSICINQYDVNNQFLQSFSSIADAARFIKGKDFNKGVIGHISDVCKGKRKTAYGYIWKYN